MRLLLGVAALISLCSSAIAATLNDPSYAGWGPWGPFCECTKKCGGGTQYRLRVCANPPVYGKIPPCKGSDKETRECNTKHCEINGGYSSWSKWSGCNKSCGKGYCTRIRTCTNPRPQYGGKSCSGPSKVTKVCSAHPCPVDGYCDAYGSWGKCSKTCGGGTCTRTRTCYPPKYGGKAYKGSPSETRSCGTKHCPVDGYCDAYGSWGKCTKTCGGGTCTRTRKCHPPKYGGKAYKGSPSETRSCGTKHCPVDGYCDAYGSWTKCSKTCGGGFCSRKRKCYPPKYGGKPCPTPYEETKLCGTHPCPVNGGYSSWSSWSSCSKTCGRGLCTRSRACINPRPLYGGKACEGAAKETTSCYIRTCKYGSAY